MNISISLEKSVDFKHTESDTDAGYEPVKGQVWDLTAGWVFVACQKVWLEVILFVLSKFS